MKNPTDWSLYAIRILLFAGWIHSMITKSEIGFQVWVLACCISFSVDRLTATTFVVEHHEEGDEEVDE